MCDIYKDSIDSKRKKTGSKNSLKSNNFIDILNDLNESKSLKADTSQSGSQSPSSFTNPSSPVFKHSGFLQNFSIKSSPSCDQLHLKFSQINVKSQRFIKVTNDLKNKIELLEEIYSGPEYKKSKVKNKLIQCNINIDTPAKIVFNLISKLNPNSDICFGRSIHPAYSNENNEDVHMNIDSSNMFKVPESYQDPLPSSQMINNNNEFLADFQPVNCEQSTPDDSFFLEHDDNTYVRVDDVNYHLVQSITEDGIVVTETGLQLTVPDGTKIPNKYILTDSIPTNQMIVANDQYASPLVDQVPYYEEPIPDPISYQPPRKNYKDNAFLTHYTYQTSNPAKPFSDYVGLPPRPPPHMPFTLSSQLYTPELSIGLTDRDCELMLTIDCSKKTQPQQPSLYYQIYSYKDEDRYSKPTSEVWGLVGEIRACPLPMFCTISIPSGVHKHYFSIRSVDEFNRFSDWSNVVQVEVESNQNSTNGR